MALVAGTALFPLDVAAQNASGEGGDGHSTGVDPVVRYLGGSGGEMPRSLRRRLSPREQAYLRKHRRAARREKAGGLGATNESGPSTEDLGGFPEIGYAQSFAINPNPTPRLNLGRTFSTQLRRAGDIDGDGTGDYLYNANIRFGLGFLVPSVTRDERTPELEDVTGKTTVFFGGSPAEEEDQFFYRSLRPVGDINGDDHADAAEINIG